MPQCGQCLSVGRYLSVVNALVRSVPQRSQCLGVTDALVWSMSWCRKCLGSPMPQCDPCLSVIKVSVLSKSQCYQCLRVVGALASNQITTVGLFVPFEGTVVLFWSKIGPAGCSFVLSHQRELKLSRSSTVAFPHHQWSMRPLAQFWL